MPSLMDLFPEILEEVMLKVKSVEDVISLGSSRPSQSGNQYQTFAQEALDQLVC